MGKRSEVSESPSSVELVERVIAKLRAEGSTVRVLSGSGSLAKPLPEAVLSGLEAPGGGLLPPSLAAWLAFDAEALDLIDGKGVWNSTTLRDYVTEELEDAAEELEEDEFDVDEAVEAMFDDSDVAEVADLPALRLSDSASQAHFLVFDGSAEPVVYGYEKEEFWVKYQNFGRYVAHVIGGERYEEL